MDKLNKYIVQVSELLCHRVDVEASSREEAINKIKGELENEKKQREATEEMLLSLLEETCNKLDVAAQH